MKRSPVCLMLLALAVPLVGCAGSRTYVNEEADFGFYTNVGVVPFSNLSADRSASDKVTAGWVTELLISGKVQVATMGDFVRAIRQIVKEDRTNWLDGLTAEEVKSIGEVTKVQGLFVGAVKDFSMVRSGQEEFPLVSVTIRFIDCQSGQVVWSEDITRKGGPKFPIFSFGETHTLGEMTAKVCREAAASFAATLK
ncbi:MAG: hypothetical protein AB1644_07960 [Candidatus Zixiibacteriota bacterium]